MSSGLLAISEDSAGSITKDFAIKEESSLCWPHNGLTGCGNSARQFRLPTLAMVNKAGEELSSHQQERECSTKAGASLASRKVRWVFWGSGGSWMEQPLNDLFLWVSQGLWWGHGCPSRQHTYLLPIVYHRHFKSSTTLPCRMPKFTWRLELAMPTTMKYWKMVLQSLACVK